MKRLCLLISFIITCGCAIAQTEQPPAETPPQKGQNIEALKVAFISKELNLTPEEAQKFWPVYNQYSKEINNTSTKADANVLDHDERILNVRKHYNNEFIKILGPDRTNTMFGAESRFHQLLIRTMRRQQRLQVNRPIRSFLRRN
jgi:hypothetical protein